MVNTENLQVEYSLLFLLFSRPKETYQFLSGVCVDSDYFASVFHREIVKCLFDLIKNDENFRINTFKQYFLTRANSTIDDEAKFEDMVSNVKANKPADFSEIKLLTKILIECYIQRKMLSLMNEYVDNKNNKPIEELISDVYTGCRTFGDLLDSGKHKKYMGLKSGLQARIQRAVDVYTNPDKSGMVLTGLKNIDKWIGRQSPGTFVIYQARTGVGKSMMLMGTALANYKRGLKVIVITIEMSDMDYLYRFDSNLTGIEHKEFAQGTITKDQTMVKTWEDEIKQFDKYTHDLIVYWEPENCTPTRIETIIENNPYKPDLVIVDYAGDMSSGLKGVPNNDPKAQAEIYDRLKSIAGKYECVVYTAQQSKRGTKGHASTETGAWSDKASSRADIMMAVEQTKEDEDFMTQNDDGTVTIGRMTVSIIKGRNIPKCKTHIIPRFARMTWLEKEEKEMIQAGNVKEMKTQKSEMKKAETEFEKKTTEESNQPVINNDDDDIDLLLEE